MGEEVADAGHTGREEYEDDEELPHVLRKHHIFEDEEEAACKHVRDEVDDGVRQEHSREVLE